MNKPVKKIVAKSLNKVVMGAANTHATVDSAWWLNKPVAPKSLKK